MKWPKDRRKAFMWAAEAFGTPYNKRTEDQKSLTSRGFCRTIMILTGSREIVPWIFRFADQVGINSMFWWPCRGIWGWTPSCDKQRSPFCYLMATLSDKEFEELQA